MPRSVSTSVATGEPSMTVRVGGGGEAAGPPTLPPVQPLLRFSSAPFVPTAAPRHAGALDHLRTGISTPSAAPRR